MINTPAPPPGKNKNKKTRPPHWKEYDIALRGKPRRKKLSVPTGRSDGLTGRSHLYPLEEAMASPEEALFTHWKKRWPHRKKLSVPTGRSDGLTGRSSLYP
jgi:hypothetical protein